MKLQSDIYPSKIFQSLFILYIVLSAVNWLPFISADIIRSIKYLLFIFIFFYERQYHKLKFPSLYLSPIGLLLILITMITGLFLSFNFSALVDIVLPFVFLWIFNFERDFYFKALYKASLIVALICLISSISYITGFFDIQAPDPWEINSFSNTGFGGYTTGYSNSLFLYVPLIIFFHRKNNKSFFSVELLAVLSIILAQYFSGGRAGLLSSILIFFFGFRFSIIYKFVFLFAIFFYIQTDEFLYQIRVVDLYGEELEADKISSGRIGLSTYYYEKFLERPFFGFGFGDSKEIDTSLEVHIVWLRSIIEGGLFYTILLIGIFLGIFKSFFTNHTLSKDERSLFYSIFFISFIITFLEPKYLIGSVQGELMYWVIISLLLKRQLPHLKDQYEVI